MEEKALAVREKCNAIQEQVTAKAKRLRKDESKYRKLKKEYDGMASAEVDLSNSLEDCEKCWKKTQRDILESKTHVSPNKFHHGARTQCECFRK